MTEQLKLYATYTFSISLNSSHRFNYRVFTSYAILLVIGSKLGDCYKNWDSNNLYTFFINSHWQVDLYSMIIIHSINGWLGHKVVVSSNTGVFVGETPNESIAANSRPIHCKTHRITTNISTPNTTNPRNYFLTITSCGWLGLQRFTEVEFNCMVTMQDDSPFYRLFYQRHLANQALNAESTFVMVERIDPKSVLISSFSQRNVSHYSITSTIFTCGKPKFIHSG